MVLLERSPFLAELNDLLSQATRGEGRLVLLGGEAGAGKTVLVQEFCRSLTGGARVLVGACDPLSAPRPLGPLFDIAHAVGGELQRLLETGESRERIFAGFLAALSSPSGPRVVVFEDMHWADEATLDLLRFLGRRISSTHTLLVITYRSDEVGARHPLRVAMGDLATTAVPRLMLPPLSEDAVGTMLRGSPLDPGLVHRQTGGNPFYVSEVMAGGTEQIPETVRDAVLARAARLSPAARGLIEAVAVTPPQAELWLLAVLAGDAVAALDECLASGMLKAANGAVAFRHELARRAIEEATAPDRGIGLHRAALAALVAPPAGAADLARLAHHAERAGDAEAVLRFAQAAGARASSLGAHREAAAQYARALRFAARQPLPEHAELLEHHSFECYVTTRDEEALASTLQALDCYRKLGDRCREGDQLRWLALVRLNSGYAREAVETAREAVSLLEELPPGHELAMAYCTLAGACVLTEDADEIEVCARRALDLAQRLDDHRAYVNALQSLGAADALRGRPSGIEQLERCLALAQEAGLENQVGRGYVLLAVAGCRERSLARMEEYVEPALVYCERHDLDVWGRILLAMRGWIALERGDWDQAAETSARVLMENCTLSCLQARVVLGLLRARRGDPDAWTPLAQAREVAERTGQLFWLWQVAAAEAEARWLDGRPEDIAKVTHATFELAVRLRSPWPVAELAWWRRQGGVQEPIPEDAGGPFSLQLRGDWAGAAEAWRSAGCPYEEALALAGADDDEALRRALAELQRLGARPAAAIVTHRLRERGARGLSRGSRLATRNNVANLTAREFEVLGLMAEGLRNTEIAERLVLSPRTVDHHVSAILGKLGVRSRADAARAAIAARKPAPYLGIRAS